MSDRVKSSWKPGLLLAALCAAAAAPAATHSETYGYFGEPLRNVSVSDWSDFQVGLREFSHVWTAEDGVGERYNEHSCIGCHAIPMPGGSGITSHTFVWFSPYIHDDEGGHAFRRLRRSQAGEIELQPPPGATRRKAPILFGLGLLEAVPVELLAEKRVGPDHVNGRFGGRSSVIGRFGWKASAPGIQDFVRAAIGTELGVDSNSPIRGKVLTESIAKIVSFVRLLGPPPSRRANSQEELAAANLFHDIGCSQCHRESLITQSTEGNSFQIFPYTDLLLHDMGPDRSDKIIEGNALGSDFRTAPLWGLQSSGPPYMHDGAARDIAEAIELHDGEARASRFRWDALSHSQQERLIGFLRAL